MAETMTEGSVMVGAPPSEEPVLTPEQSDLVHRIHQRLLQEMGSFLDEDAKSSIHVGLHR